MTREDRPSADTEDSGGLGRLGAFSVGLVFLLIFALLFYGLFFEERPEDTTFPQGFAGYVVSLLLLGFLGTLAASWFLSCSRNARMQRMSEWCHTAASGGLLVFLFAISLRAALTVGTPESPSRGGGATFAVLLGFVLGTGLLSLVTSRRKGVSGGERGERPPESSLSLAFFWPLMLLLKSPVIGMVCFLVVGGIVYLGERMGTRFGHPLLGACGGLGTVLAAVWIFGGRSRERTGEQREGRKRDA